MMDPFLDGQASMMSLYYPKMNVRLTIPLRTASTVDAVPLSVLILVLVNQCAILWMLVKWLCS